MGPTATVACSTAAAVTTICPTGVEILSAATTDLLLPSRATATGTTGRAATNEL